MKWSFVTLLVLNVAYFAWEFNRHLPPDTAGNSTDALRRSGSVEQLRLLNELDRFPELRPNEKARQRADTLAAERDDASRTLATPAADVLEAVGLATREPRIAPVPPVAGASDAPEAVCFSVGPLATDRKAGEVQNWLQELNVETEQRVEEQTIATRYWIFLETTGSGPSARERLAELESKGVEDFLLTREQDGSRVISLGLYGTRASLDRRLADLRKAGIEPQVRPRHRLHTVHWVDVSQGVQSSVLRLLQEHFSAAAPIVRRSCGPEGRATVTTGPGTSRPGPAEGEQLNPNNPRSAPSASGPETHQ